MSARPDPAGAIPGWYGKLAGLGDFAHRRLPPEFVHACDAWLATAMRHAGEALGERWLQVYLRGPLLRFGWAPGVVDARWWFGLLMPSCDSVGRYFPLLIAQAREQAPRDRIALDHLERWLAHLADAAMQTLQGGLASIDLLEAALQEAPHWPTPGRASTLHSGRTADSEHHCLGRGAPLSHWLHAIAMHDFAGRLDGRTVWWRVTPEGSEDALDILHGLPDGVGFAELLMGMRA
jgi:type VI secretion system protein ImpM